VTKTAILEKQKHLIKIFVTSYQLDMLFKNKLIRYSFKCLPVSGENDVKLVHLVKFV